MGQDTIERLAAGFKLEQSQRDCGWCGSAVTLPAGDLVGVCISCGMVVFRHEAACGQAACHSMSRDHEDVPTPA